MDVLGEVIPLAPVLQAFNIISLLVIIEVKFSTILWSANLTMVLRVGCVHTAISEHVCVQQEVRNIILETPVLMVRQTQEGVKSQVFQLGGEIGGNYCIQC